MLSVGGLNARHLTAPLDGNGETVRNVTLQDVAALTGLKYLEVWTTTTKSFKYTLPVVLL